MESDSYIYGLLGRIHVLMRRTVNRITDVEYMRVNADYAREIVRIGETTGNADLFDLCAKLKVAMELEAALPEGKTTKPKSSEEKRGLLSVFGQHRHPPEDDEGDNKYIRSLR